MRSKDESQENNNLQDVSVEEGLGIPELVCHIVKIGLFTNQEVSTLSKTSKTLHDFLVPELNKRRVKKLLTHVVWGEQDKAEAMIKANPALLSVRSNALDPSERTIEGTAFQAAIGAGDEPMWNMMLPYFKRLEQGEALKQFHEQFPNGIEVDVPAEQLKKYYDDLTLAIIKDNEIPVIEQFRKDITSQKEITEGKHFNLQHLVAAYQAYIDNYNLFETTENRVLFCKKIIGYVQRQMTAYDAQIHCFGILSAIKNKDMFERTFAFKDVKFFPLSPDSNLGFDFGCFSHERDALKMEAAFASELMKLAMNTLNQYVEDKQMTLQNLKSHLSEECTASQINCL